MEFRKKNNEAIDHVIDLIDTIISSQDSSIKIDPKPSPKKLEGELNYKPYVQATNIQTTFTDDIIFPVGLIIEKKFLRNNIVINQKMPLINQQPIKNKINPSSYPNQNRETDTMSISKMDFIESYGDGEDITVHNNFNKKNHIKNKKPYQQSKQSKQFKQSKQSKPKINHITRTGSKKAKSKYIKKKSDNGREIIWNDLNDFDINLSNSATMSSKELSRVVKNENILGNFMSKLNQRISNKNIFNELSDSEKLTTALKYEPIPEKQSTVSQDELNAGIKNYYFQNINKNKNNNLLNSNENNNLLNSNENNNLLNFNENNNLLNSNENNNLLDFNENNNLFNSNENNNLLNTNKNNNLLNTNKNNNLLNTNKNNNLLNTNKNNNLLNTNKNNHSTLVAVINYSVDIIDFLNNIFYKLTSAISSQTASTDFSVNNENNGEEEAGR